MFLVKSHVPSPTTMVSEEYELDPGGDSVSAGAMMAMGASCQPGTAAAALAGMECRYANETRRQQEG